MLLPNSPEENQRVSYVNDLVQSLVLTIEAKGPPSFASKILAFITGKKKSAEEIALSKLSGFFSSRLHKSSLV